MSINDAKWTVAPDVLASSITSFLFLTFVSCNTGNFFKFSFSFSTVAFAPGIFNAWGIGMNLCTRLKWVREFVPFAVMWSFFFSWTRKVASSSSQLSTENGTFTKRHWWAHELKALGHPLKWNRERQAFLQMRRPTISLPTASTLGKKQNFDSTDRWWTPSWEDILMLLKDNVSNLIHNSLLKVVQRERWKKGKKKDTSLRICSTPCCWERSISYTVQSPPLVRGELEQELTLSHASAGGATTYSLSTSFQNDNNDNNNNKTHNTQRNETHNTGDPKAGELCFHDKGIFSWRHVAILACKSFVILGYWAVACFSQDSWKMNSVIKEEICNLMRIFFELISPVTIIPVFLITYINCFWIDYRISNVIISAQMVVIPSLVPRHVSFHLILTFLYLPFAHRLRLEVDHVRNTLRRFTRPQRWRFDGSRTSHRLRAQKDCRQPDRHWVRDWALCWRESDSRNWG